MGFFAINPYNMAKVKVKTYPATKVILLAFDWADGKGRKDFLGFAIRRTPGFKSATGAWLPNRISFKGKKSANGFFSNDSPIQKFMWWDAAFEDKDIDKTYTYEITPVVGTPDKPQLLQGSKGTIKVTPAPAVRNGIGTYFNRAVVSSQSFSRRFVGEDKKFDEDKLEAALAWLSNGFEKVIPGFLDDAAAVEGAIYHLTDDVWIIPALENFGKSLSLVYDEDKNDKANEEAIETLGAINTVQLLPRARASIMHNKFLVNILSSKPKTLLMGSANFSTEAISSQANLLHTFENEELAQLYLDRKRLLEEDPTKGETAKEAGWSDPIKIGKATIRVFFAPEKKPGREALDPVEDAIKKAKSSALFCIFSPTDKGIRDALFKAGDKGKMMFGLINSISDEQPESETQDASFEARVAVYHRKKENRDVYSAAAFGGPNAKAGFWWELKSIPKKVKKNFPVFIHHKFIIIDGETDNPIIYTGSANLSNNSNYNNDENFLEIKGDPDIAKFYMAEFFRLYEHYRARAFSKKKDFNLAPDSSWAKDAYKTNSPEAKARINMAK